MPKKQNDPPADTIQIPDIVFEMSRRMVEHAGPSPLNIMEVVHWAHTILEACRRRAETQDRKAIVQDLTSLEVHLASFILGNIIENPNSLEVSVMRGPIELDPDENSVLPRH